jgi:hypothetical protein
VITSRPLREMMPQLAPRTLIVEAPTVKQWGPFFRARYPSPTPHTIWAFVLLVPFTSSKSSIQVRFVKFDRR